MDHQVWQFYRKISDFIANLIKKGFLLDSFIELVTESFIFPAFLEIKTVGESLVRIKGIKSGRYLAMNKHGKRLLHGESNKESYQTR